MSKKIVINEKIIDGSRTYIIAEAGSNHNGNIEIAKKLIKEAANAGADAIKFQTFRAKDHYSKHTPSFSYLEKSVGNVNTYELISKLEIDRAWHESLIEYANQCNITFLSSPCDKDAVDELAQLNMAAFKVASFDLPDLNLIRHMAKYKKPLILSTGMANYSDIQDAINVCLDEGNNEIILLQCTSLYPAPVNLSNLAAISTMQKAFGCLVGYSDHTLGEHIPLASVALGSCMIEKHFTLDRSLPGPDHNFAIEPNELKRMILHIRDVEASIGDGIKNGPRNEEVEMLEKGRRSIHTLVPIKKGEIITEDKVCIKRPGLGIPPKYLNEIIGMKLMNDLPEDYWISWGDLK